MFFTKENTLYLPIKQVYFDQIIEGTKNEEYRDLLPSTASRYLVKEDKNLVCNPENTKAGKKYTINSYNGGRFPFNIRRFKYLHLAVGYAKVRDEAFVEIVDIKPFPKVVDARHDYAEWTMTYKIGKIVKLERKKKGLIEQK